MKSVEHICAEATSVLEILTRNAITTKLINKFGFSLLLLLLLFNFVV